MNSPLCHLIWYSYNSLLNNYLFSLALWNLSGWLIHSEFLLQRYKESRILAEDLIKYCTCEMWSISFINYHLTILNLHVIMNCQVQFTICCWLVVHYIHSLLRLFYWLELIDLLLPSSDHPLPFSIWIYICMCVCFPP